MMSAASWWRKGVKAKQPEIILELLERVFVCPNGCWWWLGGTCGKGRYGRILKPGTRRMMAAHRYVYNKFVAIVSKEEDIHHTCLNSLCVNPDHLEVKTKKAHIELHNEMREAKRWSIEQELSEYDN